MKYRDFLTDVTIVCGVLVSRAGNILHYTIPNWLKWCDWVLIVFDNEDEKTKQIVLDYQRKYPNRIRIEHSGFKPIIKRLAGRPIGFRQRFMSMRGPLKDTVLSYFRKAVFNGEKVDILIYPDSDEIFTDSLKDVLINFWQDKRIKAVFMKPLNVFGDLKTITNRSMGKHIRILKFFTDLTAIPYRGFCFYNPLEMKDCIINKWVMVHLNNLMPETRGWRAKNWRLIDKKEVLKHPLWSLDKVVTKMKPRAIQKVFRTKTNLNIGKYLNINKQIYG